MNLKKLRLNKNMTQCELAKAVDISQQAISQWENGKAEPPLDMVAKLADVLGCTITEVVECFQNRKKGA